MKAENLQFSEKYMSNVFDIRLFCKIPVKVEKRPLCATGRNIFLELIYVKTTKVREISSFIM